MRAENIPVITGIEIPYINEESQIKRSDFFLKNGDLIIADTAEDETVGKATELFNAENCNIVSGLHTIPCRPRIKFASKYLGYYVNSYYYHKQLLSLMQGIKVLSISKSNISKTFIKYPCQKEQKKIAAFLSLLDKRITKQRELVDYLKSYKRGVLSKLFPQKGESVPKCRFTGFAEPWEQRKLGAMMNVTSVKRIHQSDWTNSGIRFLRARDIVAASKGEEPTDYLYISQEKFDEYSALSGKVKIGDLLVTGVGTIGVPMLIKADKPLYFKDGNIIWFQNQNKIDGNFLYYSFVGDSIQSFIKDSAGTGTVRTYTIDTGKKTPIMIPIQYAEQQKIGEYFRNLDHLIALHMRKLDEIQAYKSGLLQILFI